MTESRNSVRCPFCWMPTRFRWLGIPLCNICRDQLYDFMWVTVVQIVLWLAGVIDGYLFVMEEVLLFSVLVLIKHRIKPPWDNQHSA